MTPAAILALVRDIAILAGIGFVLWYVAHAEHNADALASIKATLTQQATWQKDANNASTKAANSLDTLDAHLRAIDERGPVIVRVPVPQTVPAPSTAHGAPLDAGPGAPAPGAVLRPIDLRPVLEGPERQLSTSMIECQRVLDAWPK